MRNSPPRPRPAKPSGASAPRPPERNATPAPLAGRGRILYGIHPVTMAWLNPDRICRQLYATAQAATAFAETIERGRTLRRPVPIIIDRDAIDRLLPPGSVHQGLVLDAEPLPEVGIEDVIIATGDGPATLVILDQVTDPHNVGAILRSAAALGARAVIVQSRHAPEITGVLAKAASGAVDVVPIVRETNLARAIARLRDAGFIAIGLAERADIAIGEAAFGSRVVLVLGAEGEGLRRLVAEGCDILASLPTQPPIGSLNVSNAAAVGLYEITRRRPRRPGHD